ncbi:unnamed protein product [Cyclocybe aegerita]|uniref:MYND-type domain-containing protein n=1 Tax=Cyclocybe aegerita TaxID=1973307 RepID=A0A8S0WHJ6_CYCAE|nr:unnamed protein product [Cyclocybe aegerita]
MTAHLLTITFYFIAGNTSMATKANLSLSSAIELLVSTMQDPMKADACPVRMAVAADCINLAFEACTSVAAEAKLAKSHPELLRAGVKFLTHKQSPQDHCAMMNHLSTCRCDFNQPGMRRAHKPNRHRPDGRIEVCSMTLLFDAMSTICMCLVVALEERTQHKFYTGNAGNGEKLWPQGPEDLLPEGPKDAVLGLELWVVDTSYGCFIFKLASRLALFYKPFAREAFQAWDFPFALVRPSLHLQEAVKFYDDSDPSRTSPRAFTFFFQLPVVVIVNFFDTFMHYDTRLFKAMICLRGRWFTPIFARLTTILSTQECGGICSLSRYITAYANAEIDCTTGLMTVTFEREFMTKLQHRDLLGHAFTTMVMVRRMGCWNIACPSASQAIYSRLCSKCNLIRFCGEQCQKEAWKSPNLPHKSVCAKIHSLKESIGAEAWPLLWTADFSYRKFQGVCKAKNVDAEAVKAIGSTITALRISKDAFRRNQQMAGLSQIDRLRCAEGDKALREREEELIRTLGEDLG